MATTSDRWLWLTLGLTAIIAAKYIRHAITDTVDLTAIDRPKAPITKPKSGTPEDSLSLPVLRTLSNHPNPRISSAAKSIIVQLIEASQFTLSEINADAASSNDKLSRTAKEALRFLEEWGSSGPSGYTAWEDTERDDDDDEGPPVYMTHAELRDMASELLRRRPRTEGVSNDERLTSLADELGLAGGGNVNLERLLENVRILGAVGERSEEEGSGGHMQNARQLGTENFAGLSDSRWAPEDVRETSTRERAAAARRRRREAMVIEDEREDDGDEALGDGILGDQRGWWVV